MKAVCRDRKADELLLTYLLFIPEKDFQKTIKKLKTPECYMLDLIWKHAKNSNDAHKVTNALFDAGITDIPTFKKQKLNDMLDLRGIGPKYQKVICAMWADILKEEVV